MQETGAVLVFVTSAALIGLVVLNPALIISLLDTLKGLLTQGFGVARGGAKQ